ncbi:His-Xaa-Ser system protein HsxD [Enterobacter sp. MGH 7]|nr:His-Xaa-Ser system protein HsxD [Enterobacter sp. MGH 7]KJF31029.1 His-Xaa-Ser system protein HsxD [Enterobacter hormaechei]SAA75353.1 His-Xaa-Ser system protein HsxD [Enterobacter hormaechei]
MTMWEKVLQKDQFSEWVIRNTLYWMTPVTSWKLEENISSWIIFFETSSPECEFEFGRLLNDFSLREKLHHQTGQLRDAIVSKVLRSIDDRLA